VIPKEATRTSEASDALVCRCEAVRVGDLLRALSAYDISDLRQLKLLTRSGMGMCQGRVCRPTLEALARAWGFSNIPGALRVRPPLRPRSMASYADAPESEEQPS
jgi:hypothetical protein